MLSSRLLWTPKSTFAFFRPPCRCAILNGAANVNDTPLHSPILHCQQAILGGIPASSFVARFRRGFTLVEMLVVIVIIALLMAIVTPSFYSAIMATRLTSSGGQLVGMLSNAQQIATSEGCTVEVRFYKYNNDEFDPGADPRFRSVLLLRHFEQGAPNPDPNPANQGKPLTAPMALVLGEVLNLSQDLVLSENNEMSTFLANLADGNSTVGTKVSNASGLSDYTFRPGSSFKSFIFRPEGTNLNPAPPNKWFVTLVVASDEEEGLTPDEVKNFYCVQVDPSTGRITSYRP
ncbi:Verru_Chthon cassette protein D [Phragmitibacter flavus]